MAEKTLEEFISEYVKGKEKSNTRESYESWLRTNGINADGIYANALRNAEADYGKSIAGYGENAESLSRLGLSASGYSDYMNGKAYSEMQKSKHRAGTEYADNKRRNASDYKSYVEDYEKRESSLFKDVVDKMGGDGVTDYETAYKYAVSIGLSDKSAAAAANAANENAKSTLRSSVLKLIISTGLTEKQAYSYALGIGLGEEDARLLERYAETINKYYSTDR